MNMTIPHWESIAAGTSFVAEITGRHVGMLRDKTYLFIQTSPGAYTTLIGANVLFFNTALSICSIVNDLFDNHQHKEDQLNKQCVWRFTLLFTTLIGGANFLLYKQFKIPLPTWKVLGVSVITGITCLSYKTW